MKKAFDQTVRELKREVNKSILKVPEVEQMTLDATSNEPWGPHGAVLADIAQATRNYHDYQMIMNIIWRRMNDTGKNWRHVYKALTVLEYLVAHGSERVIDDVKEHGYQISTLSHFQYIDSHGRDQGNNVRRKSETLHALVNNKERIQEVREKAAANKDKYRGSFSGRSSPYGGYDDRYEGDRYEDRYGSRDGDRNGYGREREWGYRDDDRYGRNEDSYRNGDRNGENYGRNSTKDDDYRGGNHSFGGRNRSFDGERDRPNDDDDRYSSRSGGGKGDEYAYSERGLEQKVSEQSVGGPPSYAEAMGDTQSVLQQERSSVGGGAVAGTSPSSATRPSGTSPGNQVQHAENVAARGPDMHQHEKVVDSFDEFDPRSAFSAVGPQASSLDPINSLALVPVSSVEDTEGPTNSSFEAKNFAAMPSTSTAPIQTDNNPFGDSPFKAFPQEQNHSYHPSPVPASSFQVPPTPVVEATNFDLMDPLSGITYTPTTMPSSQLHMFGNSAPFASETPLPQFGAEVHATHLQNPWQVNQSAVLQPVAPAMATQTPQTYQTSAMTVQPFASQAPQATPVLLQPTPPVTSAAIVQLSSPAPSSPFLPEAFAEAALPAQPVRKFEPKSTVWADTLNRGLVDLNISGPKINPHANIGVDFESMNRREKREEKKLATPMVSTTAMGKAMGSGSGMGHAAASGLVPPPNPAMGRGIGVGSNQPVGYGAGMAARPAGFGAPPARPGMPGYNPMAGGGYKTGYGYGYGYK